MIQRQGDILIVACKSIPANAKPVPKRDGRTILAEGEVTGHFHSVIGDCELLASDVAEMEDRFLRVEAESQVVHDEHATLTLAPGNYIVRRQLEYSPESVRQVAD